MDWKKENPKARYIDSINWKEAERIAFLAAGQPEEFELLKLDARCNGNNIPHVELHFRAFEPVVCDGIVDFVGIFSNLNTYVGNSFHQAECQKELFKAYSEFGFD